ncbi:MAG: hypothetical protein WAT66_10115 [Actinomycetota bacterium]
MRETLGPLLASLGQVKRRSILFLFGAMLVVWGLITWGSYTEYRSQRDVVQRAEEGVLKSDDVYRLVGGGVSCQPETPPTGDQPPESLTCQFTTRDGQPVGDPFEMTDFNKFTGQPGEEDPFVKAVRDALPRLLPDIKADLARQAARLAPLSVLRDRAETIGTFFGILFVVIITATFIGAEWRWGVWRTLLTHEPRRGRVLAAKFGAVWIAVALGTIAVLAVTAGLDTIFRRMTHIDASGGPAVLTVARVTGRSLLSLELYATVAAALATIIRTSFAGIGSLLFILGDGLASRRFTWLRHFAPTQQIATLLPADTLGEQPGYAWWPLITHGPTRCAADSSGAVSCSAVPLKPIPHWRASVVLIGWLVAFALATWAVLRARDVPQ